MNLERHTRQRVARFYEQNPRMVSSPFGGIDSIDRELIEKVFADLEIDLTSRRVLDIGCGRGLVGELVREAGGHYFGADLVPSGAGFALARADAARLPFADETFDAVFCIDAFEHILRPLDAAREFRRVLRPEGFVFLSAPNYGNVAGLVKRVYEGLGLYERDTWAPFGRWAPQELEHRLTLGRVRQIYSAAGFTRQRVIGLGREVGLGLFPWIDHPSMPDAIRFRLQRFFRLIGPPIARAFPSASLHGLWCFRKN